MTGVLVMGASLTAEYIGPGTIRHGKRIDAVRAQRGWVTRRYGLPLLSTFAPAQDAGGSSLDMLSFDVRAALGEDRPVLRDLEMLADLDALLDALKGHEEPVNPSDVLAFDLETDTNGQITVAGAAVRGMMAASPWDGIGYTAKTLRALIELVEGAGGTTCGWNSIGFDNPLLSLRDVPVGFASHIDGMLLWRAAYPQARYSGLLDVAPCFSFSPPWKTDEAMYDAADNPGDALVQGCALDCAATLAAVLGIGREGKAAERLLTELHDTARVTQRMTQAGVVADVKLMDEMKRGCERKKVALQTGRIPTGVNPGSPAQVSEWAAGRGIEIASTARADLLGCGVPELEAVEEWRAVDQQRKLIEKVREHVNPETGRIHSRFKVPGAVTGRLSSTDPNLQNIPASMRLVVTADDGHMLISADYSGIEMRLAALLSGDKTLRRLVEDGVDLHTWGASKAFGKPEADVTKDERQAAKTVNYSILYGAGRESVVKRSGEAAGVYHDAFPELFPELDRWMKRNIAEAQRRGCLTTPFGRTRRWLRASPTEAANFPIQAAAASVFHLGLRRAYAVMPAASLRLPIHDEIVASVPERYAGVWQNRMRKAMEQSGRRARRRGVPRGRGRAGADVGRVEVAMRMREKRVKSKTSAALKVRRKMAEDLRARRKTAVKALDRAWDVCRDSGGNRVLRRTAGKDETMMLIDVLPGDVVIVMRGDRGNG